MLFEWLKKRSKLRQPDLSMRLFAESKLIVSDSDSTRTNKALPNSAWASSSLPTPKMREQSCARTTEPSVLTKSEEVKTQSSRMHISSKKPSRNGPLLKILSSDFKVAAFFRKN